MKSNYLASHKAAKRYIYILFCCLWRMSGRRKIDTRLFYDIIHSYLYIQQRYCYYSIILMIASLFLLAASCEFLAHRSGVSAASYLRGRSNTTSTAGIDTNSSSMGGVACEVAETNTDPNNNTNNFGGGVLLNEKDRSSREGYRIADSIKSLRKFLVLFSGHQGTTYIRSIFWGLFHFAALEICRWMSTPFAATRILMVLQYADGEAYCSIIMHNPLIIMRHSSLSSANINNAFLLHRYNIWSIYIYTYKNNLCIHIIQQRQWSW